jgi:uncharacterized Ntn-hydrolase superfamily protein
MTYSIVARDPRTGRFGIAIQTAWPMVGKDCPWVESGVGAVTSQAYAEVAHGPNGLSHLRAGATAEEALEALRSRDPERDIRQVGIVDAAGRAAAWTGARCVEAAGHAMADGVTVQANMMERPSVWPAMLEAYGEATGAFADRLLAALRAAEAEGGDLRGGQSAALVVSGAPGEPAWARDFDIRVDDHPAPLDELERLLAVKRGFEALDRAEELAMVGDLAAAARAGAEASRLAPGDAQILVWRAIGMTAGGVIGPAQELLAQATAMNARWPEFLRRFAASGAQPELAEPARQLLGEI